MYRDFLLSFTQTFNDYLVGGLIEEIEVGVGPASELRYPAYPLDRWDFPGIGAFQCYDDYMLQMLREAANNASRPEWGAPPSNAGGYKDRPENTAFFSNNQPDNWDSEYGRFFLDWYSSVLIEHGRKVLQVATSALAGFVQPSFLLINHLSSQPSFFFLNCTRYPIGPSIKISGVHWLYNTDSHAAELTAGYYNPVNRDGYEEIAKLFAAFNGSFDFTCLEMRNYEQPGDARSNPESLVAQTRMAAERNGVKYRGENALPRYDRTAYEQIIAQSRFSDGSPIEGFTYLRLNSELMDNQQFFNDFLWFVNEMKKI